MAGSTTKRLLSEFLDLTFLVAEPEFRDHIREMPRHQKPMWNFSSLGFSLGHLIGGYTTPLYKPVITTTEPLSHARPAYSFLRAANVEMLFNQKIAGNQEAIRTWDENFGLTRTNN